MNNSRKQLIANITQLEKTLRFQQNQELEHKKSLKTEIKDYKWSTVLMLLPALLVGWKMGKGKWFVSIFKQLMDVGALTAVAHFKKQLLHLFIK